MAADPPHEISDSELLHRVQDGDQLAYSQLLDRHLPSLYRYAVKMVGNPVDAEDLVQEAFLRLWKNSGQWKPAKGKPTTWLYRILHNLCIDFHRRHRPTLDLDDVPDDWSCDLPDDELETKQRDATIRSALAELPERQRSAIILCHYHSMSNKDAANIIGVTVTALESLMARGRRALRQRLSVAPSAPLEKSA